MFNLGSPQFTGEWIAALLFVMLSVGLEYYPPFARWWKGVEEKRMVVATTGLVIVALLVGLHYLEAFDLEIGPFGWVVVGEAIEVWLVFLGGDWLIWSALHETFPRKRDLHATS